LISDARPLDEARMVRLLRNMNILVEDIKHRDGLLTKMLAAGCINQRQKELIETGATQAQKNRRMFDILRRASITEFDSFIECLIATNQQHLASLLMNDGG
jgi:Caspase recruitment domain